jgi:hypothetical protein
VLVALRIEGFIDSETPKGYRLKGEEKGRDTPSPEDAARVYPPRTHDGKHNGEDARDRLVLRYLPNDRIIGNREYLF